VEGVGAGVRVGDTTGVWSARCLKRGSAPEDPPPPQAWAVTRTRTTAMTSSTNRRAQ